MPTEVGCITILYFHFPNNSPSLFIPAWHGILLHKVKFVVRKGWRAIIDTISQTDRWICQCWKLNTRTQSISIPFNFVSPISTLFPTNVKMIFWSLRIRNTIQKFWHRETRLITSSSRVRDPACFCKTHLEILLTKTNNSVVLHSLKKQFSFLKR